MSEVKVGDVRCTNKGIVYVVTRISFNVADAIQQSGAVWWSFSTDKFAEDRLLASYRTFNEAINSKEFTEWHI